MENHNSAYRNDLLKSIDHWNEYRVPILRLSQPDNNLNFQGAMRFYFQDSGQKVATKCVNVTSSDTTKDVIDVLIEKFRPDMRMLSVPEYGLYEIHENGDERKLDPDERPIFVQLEWNQDDREGRFLLRKMDEKTRDLAAQNEEPSLKRKLSKKEKKKQDKLKKQQLKEQEKLNSTANKAAAKNAAGAKNGIAERLYNELPETSFTRSISNPEAVMKRRRAQKLEKRLQEFSLEGGQEAGGTLRIFGETINKDVSYKTLLLSTKDTASYVVKQILEKYGKDDEDPSNYCLVQLIVPHSATSANGTSDNNSVHDLNASPGLKEYILEDTDCPLLINHNHEKSKGILTFHIRLKPADYQKRRKKKPSRSQVQQQNPFHPLVVQQLNQRLQMNNNNNNSEQYSNQNSPQNSSQTSGSINNRDVTSNHPPPSFETVHSMPTMFPVATNGNMMPFNNHHQQQMQQHSISAATLPPRINNFHHQANNIHHQSIDANGTIPRQQNQQNTMMSQQPKQFNNQLPNNNNHSVGQQLHLIQPTQQQYVTGGGNDQILPALIQVKEDVEDIFLDEVITNINPTETAFRLAPTYVLYMVSRYRASTLFHPELQAPQRAELFMPFTKKIATFIRNTIKLHLRDPIYLAFWLANSSDLSHFYKQDKHLSHFTQEAQEILHDCIITSFKYLVTAKQMELDAVLDSFFDEREDFVNHNMLTGTNDDRRVFDSSPIRPIFNVLDETMATMRKNRVNAVLTIQTFSLLFHYINKWLFDRLIGVYDNQKLNNNAVINSRSNQNYSIYCNRVWGEKFGRRLELIRAWAAKHGIEQPADIYLIRVGQLTSFLAKHHEPETMPKDLQKAYDSCDRLNPVQMRALLQRFQPENMMLRAMIDNFLYTTNQSYLGNDNFPLEEDAEENEPFLIPDESYSSDMVRYIPDGLLTFVNYLSKLRVYDEELCIFTVQPTSSGFWTVYFKNHQQNRPDVITIQLRKKNNSMGLSIIAAQGVRYHSMGIYIKNVVKNGAAAMDGRLQAGDQLLEVDGNSLIGISQESAAELMQKTGPVVTLKIAKQAAMFNNVKDLIDSVQFQTNNVNPQINVLHHHNNIVTPAPSNINNGHQVIRSNMIPNDPSNILPPPIPQMVMHHTIPEPMRNNNLIQSNNHFPYHQQVPSNTQLSQMIPPPPQPQAVQQQHPQPVTQTSTLSLSPLKSPKKVSWVDTQPHQSLHTLIPASPSLIPSPPFQQPDMDPLPNVDDPNDLSTPPEIPSPPPLEELPDDIPEPPSEISNLQPDYNPMTDSHSGRVDNPKNGSVSGQHDTTTESLTLEDIDEVLSSRTHNNWVEESAGVIGTQEVYNDPRQRIVRERERPEADDSKTEQLSFKEKIEKFNLSQKK